VAISESPPYTFHRISESGYLTTREQYCVCCGNGCLHEPINSARSKVPAAYNSVILNANSVILNANSVMLNSIQHLLRRRPILNQVFGMLFVFPDSIFSRFRHFALSRLKKGAENYLTR
jgi:hypothetical protein